MSFSATSLTKPSGPGASARQTSAIPPEAIGSRRRYLPNERTRGALYPRRRSAQGIEAATPRTARTVHHSGHAAPTASVKRLELDDPAAGRRFLPLRGERRRLTQ